MRRPVLHPLLTLLAVLTPLTSWGCSPGSEAEGSPGAAPESPARLSAEVRMPHPSADDLDAEARAWVEGTLAAMNLRQRVAQLVMPWVSGGSAASNPREFQRMLGWVERDEVGGLIISRGPPAVLAAKLNAAQSRARVPLLVTSDLETGPGMRLSPGGTEFPPAMAFGAAGDEVLAREAGRVTATEARAVGIHMTLGPVLDVNSNPENPIINVRSFGEDPDRVARLASAWIRGAREGGLLSAGKHFPGHGDTEVDSHVGLASISADSARLARLELVPFRGAVGSGIDALLVGHITVAGLEGENAPPASLSRRMVGEVLRDQLGFDGLVITDALNMGAITRRYPVGEASIRALQAGADILLQPPGTSAVIDEIVQAVEAGRIAPARVEEAARRVLRAKAAAGLHRGSQVALDSVAVRVGTPAHAAVAERVAGAAITLARDSEGLVPLARPRGPILHLTYTHSGRGSAGGILNGELARAGLQMDRVRVGRATPASTYDALRARARASELVLVTVAVAPHQYRALDLSQRFTAFVEGLAPAGNRVVVTSLGNPYLLEAFPSVPAYLLAWSADAVSQRAAARALLGEAPIVGRAPVSLPPHRAGDGIHR